MLRGWLPGCALLLAAPLQAATTPPTDPGTMRAAMDAFQVADQRLQDVGWQLARGNAAFCSRVVPSIGLQLTDMAGYADPAAARAALQLKRDFAVGTAARGSPAALSGAFTPGREVVRLERLDPNNLPAEGRSDWQRLARAHQHTEAMLTEHAGITIGFGDGTEAQLAPTEVCATRFELMGDSRAALADGERVVIGQFFPALRYEEPLLAALVAHELAHNILGHAAWLDAKGRSRKHVRLTEREADRLMPWLLANAGYDPAAAVAFMTRRGTEHDGGARLSRQHDGWDERAKVVAAELPLIAALQARGVPADWPRHFRREAALTR